MSAEALTGRRRKEIRTIPDCCEILELSLFLQQAQIDLCPRIHRCILQIYNMFFIVWVVTFLDCFGLSIHILKCPEENCKTIIVSNLIPQLKYWTPPPPPGSNPFPANLHWREPFTTDVPYSWKRSFLACENVRQTVPWGTVGGWYMVGLLHCTLFCP